MATEVSARTPLLPGAAAPRARSVLRRGFLMRAAHRVKDAQVADSSKGMLAAPLMQTLFSVQPPDTSTASGVRRVLAWTGWSLALLVRLALVASLILIVNLGSFNIPSIVTMSLSVIAAHYVTGASRMSERQLRHYQQVQLQFQDRDARFRQDTARGGVPAFGPSKATFGNARRIFNTRASRSTVFDQLMFELRAAGGATWRRAVWWDRTLLAAFLAMLTLLAVHAFTSAPVPLSDPFEAVLIICIIYAYAAVLALVVLLVWSSIAVALLLDGMYEQIAELHSSVYSSLPAFLALRSAILMHRRIHDLAHAAAHRFSTWLVPVAIVLILQFLTTIVLPSTWTVDVNLTLLACLMAFVPTALASAAGQPWHAAADVLLTLQQVDKRRVEADLPPRSGVATAPMPPEQLAEAQLAGGPDILKAAAAETETRFAVLADAPSPDQLYHDAADAPPLTVYHVVTTMHAGVERAAVLAERDGADPRARPLLLHALSPEFQTAGSGTSGTQGVSLLPEPKLASQPRLPERVMVLPPLPPHLMAPADAPGDAAAPSERGTATRGRVPGVARGQGMAVPAGTSIQVANLGNEVAAAADLVSRSSGSASTRSRSRSGSRTRAPRSAGSGVSLQEAAAALRHQTPARSSASGASGSSGTQRTPNRFASRPSTTRTDLRHSPSKKRNQREALASAEAARQREASLGDNPFASTSAFTRLEQRRIARRRAVEAFIDARDVNPALAFFLSGNASDDEPDDDDDDAPIAAYGFEDDPPSAAGSRNPSPSGKHGAMLVRKTSMVSTLSAVSSSSRRSNNRIRRRRNSRAYAAPGFSLPMAGVSGAAADKAASVAAAARKQQGRGKGKTVDASVAYGADDDDGEAELPRMPPSLRGQHRAPSYNPMMLDLRVTVDDAAFGQRSYNADSVASRNAKLQQSSGVAKEAGLVHQADGSIVARSRSAHVVSVAANYQMFLQSVYVREHFDIEAVCQVLAERQNNAQDVTKLIGMLVLLTYDQPNESQRHAREANAIQLVVDCLHYHAADVIVATVACEALWQLAACSGAGSAEIVRVGGVKYVTDAMRKHSACARLQDKACGVLASLAYSQTALVRAIIAADGVMLILAAVRAFPDEVRVQTRAFAALANLAAFGIRKIDDSLREGNAVGFVVMALQRHQLDEEMQEAGLLALYNLACMPELTESINAEGGKYAVLQSYMNYGFNGYVIGLCRDTYRLLQPVVDAADQLPDEPPAPVTVAQARAEEAAAEAAAALPHAPPPSVTVTGTSSHDLHVEAEAGQAAPPRLTSSSSRHSSRSRKAGRKSSAASAGSAYLTTDH